MLKLDVLLVNSVYVFFKTFYLFIYLFIYLFLERGEGRKRGKETSLCGCLIHTLHQGTQPTPQACALTGNQINDTLVHRPALNGLSHTSQVPLSIFMQLNKLPEFFDS